MLEDGLVEFVAGNANGRRDDDAAHGDNRDLGRAATDIDDHGTRGLLDRQIGSDGRSHRLLDQVSLASAGLDGGLEDSALLDRGDAGRNADDHARTRRPRVAALGRLVNEVAKHGLGDVEIGDHAVLERAHGDDIAGRATEHALSLDADGENALVVLVDSDDGGLADDDALASHRDECVGGPQVDGKIATVLTKEHIHQREQCDSD